MTIEYVCRNNPIDTAAINPIPIIIYCIPDTSNQNMKTAHRHSLSACRPYILIINSKYDKCMNKAVQKLSLT